MEINSYQNDIHRPQVIQLWRDVLGYASGHNAPALVIDKKLAVDVVLVRVDFHHAKNYTVSTQCSLIYPSSSAWAAAHWQPH